jgi:predicted nuclease of predicted toxin-antitoxin system
MKLLFDQNLSFKLCQRLADLFPGSSQVRLLSLAEADDHALWHYAQANGFTLVSQDSDFADMAALFGPPPQVIWLRCGNQHIETLFRNHAQVILSFEHDPAAACLEIY